MCPQVVFAALAQDVRAMVAAAPALKAQKEFMLAASRLHGSRALEHASMELRADKVHTFLSLHPCRRC